MAQNIVGGGLRDVLDSQPAPQAGARPLGSVGGGFPCCFGVSHVAFIVKFGVWIAQHPARGKTVPEHLPVKHIGNPTRAKFMVFVSHGAQVSALKLLAVQHRPGVCPTPAVHSAGNLANGQMDVVDATKHLKRTRAA